jgi:lysophospholipase L1-like esterase
MAGSLVLIGDGLTASGNWDDWLPEYQVINLGISGDTSDEILARLDQVITLNPDAVVLQAGTNDLGRRRSDEYIVRNVETVLCELRKRLPHTRLLVQSVPPRERDYADTIHSINVHLRQFAPTQYAQYLDLWPALADADGELSAKFSDDRLHLSEAGYRAWLAELEPALERLFELPPTSRSITVQKV